MCLCGQVFSPILGIGLGLGEGGWVGEVTNDEGLRLKWVRDVGKHTKGNIRSAWELVEGALGTPSGLRRSGIEDPFEEELVEPHSQKVGLE